MQGCWSGTSGDLPTRGFGDSATSKLTTLEKA